MSPPPAASFGEQAGMILGAGGVIFALIGLGLIFMASRTRRLRERFVAQASTVQAQVVGLEWRSGPSPDDATMLAYPVLRYSLPSGEVVEQESVEGASPPAAKPGSTVAALVDPDDPRRVRVARESVAAQLAHAMMLTVGGTALILGALMAGGGLLLLRA